MPNDIDTLRAHLFDTIKAVKDGTLGVDKAKSISELAQVLVNTAKVECEHMRLTESKGTGFIPERIEELKPGQPRLVRGHAQSGSR